MGLTAIYVASLKFKTGFRKIHEELNLANDMALNKSTVTRPYTDPINLETRKLKNILTDTWNAEIIRTVQWLYSLGKA